MDMEQLIKLCTIVFCDTCEFYHAPVRTCPPTHRDDAMNRRCNICERLVRQCTCEWGEARNRE